MASRGRRAARQAKGRWQEVVRRATGTNTGGFPWLGVDANGAQVDIGWISIYEVRDGKITARRAINDGFALLGQLGAWAPPQMG